MSWIAPFGSMRGLPNNPMDASVNVGLRLAAAAARDPDGVAIVEPAGRDVGGKRRYRQISFRQLEDDSNLLADGLRSLGVAPGMRIVLMVRPSIDFVSLVFALFKSGAVTVLIDPGMGRKNLLRCLSDANPEGFVAIPLAHAARCLLRGRFPNSRLHVTVGWRWFWGGATIAQLRARRRRPEFRPAPTRADDPAAIIFTSGSTGPPKGVLYQHGTFDRQVVELRDVYDIRPGELDLPGFPLFGLFNCAMGVTTVLPDMDPTRPARVDPALIIESIRDWNITQAFGSPAFWNVVGRHCERHRIQLPTLRRVLSAGAPVPLHVMQRLKAAIPADGDVYTPYGATEALPVASISATEVLGETAARSRQGAGTCVGRRFPGIAWRVIRIDDGPLPTLEAAETLPPGQIGELIVSGPVVTPRYVTRSEMNALHKIEDGPAFWHRMGDVGYLDEQDRFWFCGRKAQRVRTGQGELYTIPCEAVFNQHPQVYRSALVGVGPPGNQQPVIIVETWPDQRPRTKTDRQTLYDALRKLAEAHPHTRSIERFLVHPAMPVDIRHNAKIFREKLAVWAAERVR